MIKNNKPLLRKINPFLITILSCSTPILFTIKSMWICADLREKHIQFEELKYELKVAYSKFIDINFDEVDVGVFGGHRIEGRRHELARPAPCRSEIHHHLIQPSTEISPQSHQIG